MNYFACFPKSKEQQQQQIVMTTNIYILYNRL